MAIGEDFEHAGLVATVLGKGDLLDDLATFVEVDDTTDPTFGNHGVAVGEALEGVNVGALGIVFPNNLFIEIDLGGDGPGIVEEDISIGEQLKIVMSGVAALGSAGLELPDDGAVGFANREDIFAIGSTHKDETVFFGQ